ncbi:MAG: hypothetical protein ACYCUM_04570 [Solirubrobacteraceae bacterium]
MQAIPADFPGSEIVSVGLADIEAGRETPSAMLVAMAAPRLRRVGVAVPELAIERPSHRLYELLSEEGPGAHSRYNALVGRVVSFARASEHASCG